MFTVRLLLLLFLHNLHYSSVLHVHHPRHSVSDRGKHVAQYIGIALALGANSIDPELVHQAVKPVRRRLPRNGLSNHFPDARVLSVPKAQVKLPFVALKREDAAHGDGSLVWVMRNLIKKRTTSTPETKAHNTSVILFLGQRFTDPTSETAPARRRNANAIRRNETNRETHNL